MDATDVAAVARRPILTRAPHAPPAIAGVGALFGRATPVVELARWFGEADRAGPQVVVLRGEEPAAVAVDAVEGFRDLGEAHAERFDLRAMLAQLVRPSVSADRRQAPVSERAASKESEESFLSFLLAGQRFAFGVGDVRAVLRAPPSLATVPDSDPLICGLTAYGDRLLPVLALADLLGLPAASSGWLVVVEIGGAPVGLQVEKLLGVFRAPHSAIQATPAVLNRGQGEARLAGIVRAASGLALLLSPERLFDEATTQRLMALDANVSAQGKTDEIEAAESFVIFRLGEERYGLPAAAVDAVAKPPLRLARPPNAPPFLAGVAAHRGATVPLLDQRLRLGAKAAAPAGAVIFVREGEAVTGLLVDSVERLVRIARHRLEQAPSLAGDAGELFSKVLLAESDGAPLLIVDPAPLLAYARRDLAAWDAARPRRGVR